MANNKSSVSDMDLTAWEKVQFNSNNEETSRYLDAISGQEALKRKKLLEHMVEKRKKNFQYIKDLHQGGTYFLNSVLVTKDDVQYVVNQKDVEHRARIFYYLGYSLSGLLDLTNGPNTVRAFSQLMEEWEYTFDSTPPIQGCVIYFRKIDNEFSHMVVI